MSLCACGCGRVTPISPVTKVNNGWVAGEHRKWFGVGCANRARTGFATAEERFWSKVDKRAPDACWPWLVWIGQGGYGVFADSTAGSVTAHKYAYVLTAGPVPAGLQLDHLCHTNDPGCSLGPRCPHRACCNPLHLELVTPRENVMRARTAPTAINARKTRCLRGHPLSGDNLGVSRVGKRYCITCRRERDRANYLRKKSGAA